ncbi:MAG: glycosyltransferase family 1 protein [Patescibacteria group bacterium]
MKIGIDARMYGDEQTGIGLYIKNLIENIAKIDKENLYILFLRKSQFDNFVLPASNFKKVLANSKWYSFSEQTIFLFCILRQNVDLMHFPNFNSPIFFFGKRITTIHDLTPRYFPGHKMSSLFRRLAFSLVFKNSVYSSKKIIAVSKYTKNEILKFYEVDSSKVEVIYEGIPNGNKNKAFKISNEEFLRKYNIKKPYIFYTGVWRNHKNLTGLIEAFDILRKKYKKDISLVLGGREDALYPEVRKTWESLGLEADVLRVGFIKSEEMGLFLKNADLFVLPSFVEGFGFGPLEALSYNTPVVVSDAGALPEVLGDAAIYFNPKSSEDIAEKIFLVLEDKALRDRLIQKGKFLIKTYSWERCSLKTLNLYNRFVA